MSKTFDLAILLGDLFRKCQVEVIYSDECDKDDTLAYYAHRYHADILSNDKVYGEYYITQQGYLSLTLKSDESRDHASKRQLLVVQPRVSTCTRVSHVTNGIYKRGYSNCFNAYIKYKST